MANVLVVGGAGYIGSHTCLSLSQRGFTPVVFDNLVNGHREFVQWGPFEQGDMRDRARLDQVFATHKPVAIVHFAGLIEVAESVRDPVSFFESNVAGSLNLFAAALDAGVDKLVFSSTCATYGIPHAVPIDETHTQLPISPYGRSKLMVEQILRDLRAHKKFRSVILRYFNAAGADPEGRIGERHNPESHVIPLAIAAAQGKRSGFNIYGSDYPTADGTCVRDFVHVCDLADAHCKGIDRLLAGGDAVALNLGTGHGTSVKQLVEAVERVSGKPLPVQYLARREGDPPELIADNTAAKAVLGWQPRHDLPSIIDSAWQWHLRG